MEDTESPTKPASSTATPRKKSKRRGRRLTGLSRQRRQANERERTRVHVINEGIDRLRDLIPLFPNERKPSKSDTIRLAALYISDLTDILELADAGHKIIDKQETLDEDMSVASLSFDPFDEETGELAVYLWKEHKLSGDNTSDLLPMF